MSLYHALAAQANAMGETKDPLDKTPAGLASKIRRAVAALDEQRAFSWSPGGFLTVLTSETADSFELGWRVMQAVDTWSAIDLRMAEAVYETMTFADYIGAGEAE